MSANFALCTCYIEQLVAVALNDDKKAAMKKKQRKAMRRKKEKEMERKKKLAKKRKAKRKRPTWGISLFSAFKCMKV